MKPEFKYTVCVHCATYNQEKYIADALEGFVMQKTNFPFIAVVIDDCSTDRTASVLREYEQKYPEIIKAVYLKENYFSQQKSKHPFFEPYDIESKYIALCEGDDFWTDPYKLQKQVNILDNNSKLMAVVTNVNVVDENKITLKEYESEIVPQNIERSYNLREFFSNTHHYPTCTVCYRNSHRNEVLEKTSHTKNPFFGDWTLWIALHIYGDFYFLNANTASYRINPTSLTHSNTVKRRLLLAKEQFSLIKKVQEILPPEYDDIRKNLDDQSWMWLDLAKAYKKARNPFGMIYALLRYSLSIVSTKNLFAK